MITRLMLSAFLLASPLVAKSDTTPIIYGWVERVELEPIGLSLKAKLDTGAKTSSLDARNIKVVRQDSQRYVIFDVLNPESKKTTKMKLKRLRGVRIIRHNGKHQRRHVVELEVCLGRHLRTVEVSLIDRSQFNYPLLLGRTALQNIALVDAGATFRHKPTCDYKKPTSDSKSPEIIEDAEKLDYSDEKDED